MWPFRRRYPAPRRPLTLIWDRGVVRVEGIGKMRFEAKVGGKRLQVTIHPVADGGVPGGINGAPSQAAAISDADGILMEVSEDGLVATFAATRSGSLATVTVNATNQDGAAIADEYEVIAVTPPATAFNLTSQEVD